METEMSIHYPVLPIAGSTAARGLASAMALMIHWLKRLSQAMRHRREARVLANLDRRMLADIGITRADVRDAFSEPLWEDPTALLRERAIERRMNRAIVHAQRTASADTAFTRPATDRPARQAI
jgi:uncharacterized protein YjiS (DUF1127 family)